MKPKLEWTEEVNQVLRVDAGGTELQELLGADEGRVSKASKGVADANMSEKLGTQSGWNSCSQAT